jgi:malonyl-CoA O-methyltransferase
MNASDEQFSMRPVDVQRRLDRAADTFDGADFVHRVTADGLFARLSPMAMDATNVVDLGCATGSALRPLRKHFRGATVVAVDLSRPMLRRARGRMTWPRKFRAVQGDARALPFAGGSIDLVFANLLLPWIDSPEAVFREVARVLRVGGLFAFATLGPDSLLELRRAWQAVDDGVHVRRFPDMHDIGDALVRSGLQDPVLDVDRLSVGYPNAESLLRDLTAVGARNSLRRRHRGLLGRGRFERLKDALLATRSDDTLYLQFELVYGHCWGGGSRDPSSGVAVDAGHIPLRKR